MAREQEGAVQQMEEEAPKPSRRRGRLMAAGAVLGVMVAEALVILVLVEAFVAPPPRAAHADAHGTLDPTVGQKVPEPVEVEIVKLRAQNNRSQRVLVYDLSVFVVVPSDKQEEFKQLLEKRRETIRDRFNRIVRAADPQRFQEPDLATLRAQFKHEIDQVFGKSDLAQEVLIPSIISFSEG